MRKIAFILCILLSCTFINMPISASPKVMPDGGFFDPEYYSETYPDVKAAFGTDENLLYQHYLIHGKAEGRLPYAPGAEASINVQQAVAQTAAPTLEQQVALLVQQENALRQQILNQWNTFTVATNPDPNDPRRLACVTWAQQLIEIENQIIKLTGSPTSFTVPLVEGGQAIIPSVMHTELNDFIIAGLLPAYNYTTWNKYTVVVVIANTKNLNKNGACIETVYASNGAQIQKSTFTFENKTWPTQSHQLSVFQKGVKVTYSAQ